MESTIYKITLPYDANTMFNIKKTDNLLIIEFSHPKVILSTITKGKIIETPLVTTPVVTPSILTPIIPSMTSVSPIISPLSSIIPSSNKLNIMMTGIPLNAEMLFSLLSKYSISAYNVQFVNPNEVIVTYDSPMDAEKTITNLNMRSYGNTTFNIKYI